MKAAIEGSATASAELEDVANKDMQETIAKTLEMLGTLDEVGRHFVFICCTFLT